MGVATNAIFVEGGGGIFIENKQAKALIDTGCMGSTVRQSFHEEHLADLPIRSLNEIIIECADSQPLQYAGYVMVILSKDMMHDHLFPVLVVPDTDFNTQIPILLGTNIIKVLKLQCEEIHKFEIDLNAEPGKTNK